MSTTRNPQQPCHIARLPVELLTKILLNLDPPTIALEFDSSFYEENPLFKVRLVSKQLRAVCEPILYRDLEIDATGAEYKRNLDELASKLQASPERATACRQLQAATCSLDDGRVSLRRWAQLLPNVERLSAQWGIDDVSFDHIAAFKRLRHLSVFLSGIKPPKAGVKFNLLESLHVSDIVNDHESPRFEAVSFPALRRLRVFNELQTVKNNAPDLFPSDLLANLECLDLDGEASLRLGFGGWIDVDDLPRELPVLWRLDDGRTGPEHAALPTYLRRAAHLRLDQYHHEAWSYSAARDKLRGLLDVHQSLRLVLVVEPFLSAASSPPDNVDEPILAECERRGLEVRSYSSGYEDEELVAPEFLAFVREKAARGRSTAATASRK